jgi:coiled-coil domain-containing protein 12
MALAPLYRKEAMTLIYCKLLNMRILQQYRPKSVISSAAHCKQALGNFKTCKPHHTNYLAVLVRPHLTLSTAYIILTYTDFVYQNKMSSTQASLDAQANERKARLAKLRSLKRKQSPSRDLPDGAPQESPHKEESTEDAAAQYLSGRNYDIATRGPKLGFEHAPTEGKPTVEEQAAVIAAETAKWQAEEEKADKPIDLFTLQPKKPNWDLKRDLERKLEVLNVRTDNAIAKLVRQRIQQQQESKSKSEATGNGEHPTGEMEVDGATLLEGVRMREREEAEDEQRAREDIDMN